jgi:MSHA biogenesis protein MshP
MRISEGDAGARRAHASKALCPPKQKGIGLPAAIFVITLLAVITAAVYQLVGQNAQTYQEQVNSTRAFYAAETGAGFAMNSLFPPEDYPEFLAQPTSCSDWGAGETFPRLYEFSVEGLNQCSASVACEDIAFGGVVYPTFTSTGSCDGVSRIVQIRTSYE